MSDAHSHNSRIPTFIRNLMPHATDAELEEATENVKRYLAVALRIYERLKRESTERDSTELEGGSRIPNQDA